MKSTITTVALSTLTTSPLNVRETDKDDPAVASLASSILSRGLIQPLAVHALAKPRGKHGVLAGKRRWLALRKLEAEGAAFDFAAIPVNLLEGSDDELTEISLAENYVRQNMRPHEIYAAFGLIRSRNPAITVEELADHFGLEPPRVAKILRLANLNPQLMALYAKGDLTDAQATAYAATEDRELQMAVYKTLKGRARYPHDRDAQAIRRELRVGDRDLTPLLRYVGREAYEAAGGQFECDIFDEDPNAGRILDEQLLHSLAQQKVTADRDAFEHSIERNGRRVVADGAWGISDLEFTWSDAPPKIKQYGQFYDDNELRLGCHPVEGISPDSPVKLPKKGAVIGIARIDEQGCFVVTLWYASRAAKGLAREKGSRSASGAPVEKSPNERQRLAWGLNKDPMQAMLLLRRDMIREQLYLTAAGGSSLALDFLLYSQARTLLVPKGKTWDGRPQIDGAPLGIATPASQDESGSKAPATVRELFDGLQAAPHYRAAFADVAREEWASHPDPVHGFHLFRAAGEEARLVAAAVVAAHSLNASTGFYSDGRTPRLVEELACCLELDAGAAPWADTVTYNAAFFELITHKKRLALLDSWGLGERAKSLKKAESAAFCAKAMNAIRELDDIECARLGISEEDRAELGLWRPEWLDTHSVGPTAPIGLEEEPEDEPVREAAE